jgi:hypothetical protein
MKPIGGRPTVRVLALLSAIVSSVLCSSAVAAEPKRDKSSYNTKPFSYSTTTLSYSTNVLDRKLCEQQLHRIHSAIREYRRQNGCLPALLSDLRLGFIQDPLDLICPFVKKTGSTKDWNAPFALRAPFSDSASFYAYEFCTNLVGPMAPGKSSRDYKLGQMQFMGFSVPIVRCHAHRPILNLAYDGHVFESGDDWEENFVRSPAEPKLFYNVRRMALGSINESIRRVLAPRDLNADARVLDLNDYYNALLLHLTQLDPVGRPIALHPQGLTDIDGIPFDIRGLVHLGAKEFPIEFTNRVDGIPINRKCLRIHFLHGAMFEAPDGSRIASFILDNGQGSALEIPLLYGKDVMTRWFDPSQASGRDPKPAWVSSPDLVGPADYSLRLYRTTWQNPAPETPVKAVSFVSHMTPSAPFLVAITLDVP